MAKFYGTVQGARGKATRLGHAELRTSAQSFDGSIVVKLFAANGDGETYVSIGVGTGSTATADKTLYYGPIKGLFEDQTNFGR